MHGLQLGKRGLDVIEDVSISVELPRDGEPDAFNHEGAKEHVQVNPAPPNMENMGDMGAVGYELKLQCAPVSWKVCWDKALGGPTGTMPLHLAYCHLPFLWVKGRLPVTMAPTVPLPLTE